MKSNIYFKNFIISVFFWTLTRLIEEKIQINLSLVRYAFIIIGSYFVIRNVSIYKSLRLINSSFSIFLVVILLLFLFISVVSGLSELFDPNRNFLRFKQFISNKALLYSIPLFLVSFNKPEFWRAYLKFAYLLLFILFPFVIIDLASYLTREKSPEGLIRATAGTSGFLLLVSPYLKKRKKYIIVIVYLISILFMLYHARRNMVLYFGSFLIFFYYIRFISSTRIIALSRWKTALNSLFLAVTGSIVFLILNPDFSLLVERSQTGMESRETVIEDFFIDIPPFTSVDFYFGRGMFGEVYSKYIGYDELGNLGAGYRDGIENGYLQLILNFGFIYLLVFTILSLIAFAKGFYFSNNLLAKSCGALLIINLIDMIGFGVPEITFRYILVWLSLGFCLSKKFRQLSDAEIKKIITI
jgi:hypothetical protein